jgi:hypothetical protein
MSKSASRRRFIGSALAAVAASGQVSPGNRANLPAGDAEDRARVSRADLIYQEPVARSEEGMPLGNGRMGTLVWTTPSQIRFQINRVDVYANNSYTNSFFERHNDYCGGIAYVEVDFAGSPQTPFSGPGFHHKLAVYDGLMELSGAGLRTELAAWPAADVIAIHVAPSSPSPVQVKARMLRHASQYFGNELETFAQDHISAVQTRSHVGLCHLIVDGADIVLTQEFREDDYFNKSAVAIRILGRESKPEISGETEIRLTAAAAQQPFTILISSAATSTAMMTRPKRLACILTRPLRRGSTALPTKPRTGGTTSGREAAFNCEARMAALSTSSRTTPIFCT